MNNKRCSDRSYIENRREGGGRWGGYDVCDTCVAIAAGLCAVQ